MEVTLQYVNSRIEFIISELFDVQAQVAAELEQRENRAQELRAEFVKRLEQKEESTPKIAHIEEEQDDMRKLKYGDGSIILRQRKRKDGTIRRYYQGRIYINGEQRSVYGNTIAECNGKLDELRKERAKIKLIKLSGQAESTTTARRTFGQWLDEWLKEFKEDKTRPRYYKDLCRYVDTLQSALGDLNIKRIEPMTIQRYINSLPRNNATGKLYGVLKDSLQRAEDFGIIKKNPCKVIAKPKYKQQKRRPFELEEQNAILSALSDRYKAVFFFLCATGLRIGEFLALTPQSVDFARRCIKVEESQDLETRKNGETKTAASVRKVYFAEELFECFDVQNLGGFTYNGIKKAFRKAYASLNIEGVSATHSCRHTFASLLYAAGVSDKIIQAQCGHSDVTTTLKIYTDILTCGDSPIYNYILRLKEVLTKHYKML